MNFELSNISSGNTVNGKVLTITNEEEKKLLFTIFNATTHVFELCEEKLISHSSYYLIFTYELNWIIQSIGAKITETNEIRAKLRSTYSFLPIKITIFLLIMRIHLYNLFALKSKKNVFYHIQYIKNIIEVVDVLKLLLYSQSIVEIRTNENGKLNGSREKNNRNSSIL